MKVPCRYERTTIGCHLLPVAVAASVAFAVAWSSLVVDEPARAASKADTVVAGSDQVLKEVFGRTEVSESTSKPAALGSSGGVLRLTLDEAMALFLRQNLDVLLAKFGIDAAKGRQITARLFPNPTLSVNTFSAYTQGCNLHKCGAVAPVFSQLFEVAGKRGYRIDAAGLETMSVEARFEDTVRQLGYMLKDTYFRVLRKQGHLRVDQEIRDTLMRLMRELPGEMKLGVANPDRLRLSLLATKADVEVIQDYRRIEERSADLRILLGVGPDTELDLTTDLGRRLADPNIGRLLDYALENRPDIRDKRLTRDKRKTELQLARVIRYPNVTTDLGYMMQGPHGPDNQQQWTLNFSVPLPVFDRNQGGIVEAEVGLMAVEVEIEKMLIKIQNEVTSAYRKFVFSRRLVDATQGTLVRATDVFRYAEQGFSKGQIGILDLENTDRALGDAKEEFVEALYEYQEAGIELERAAGRNLTF